MLIRSLFAFFSIFLMLSSSSDAGWDGKVIGVRDGETIIVFDGENPPISVRLNDVDGAGACVREKEFVSAAAFGKMVKVEDVRRDADGTVVAEIIMPDGKSLNEQLRRQYSARQICQMRAETSPKPDGPAPPQSPVQTSSAFSDSAKKYSPPPAERSTEPSPAPGVRTWRDGEGNIHFSGTVGENR